ncbi:MAG TPA: hypothetical protein VGY54_24095, partial [Polyangiaceae bacterium]|nr:hypothetical protein [Polyangiaceae bacterium]
MRRRIVYLRFNPRHGAAVDLIDVESGHAIRRFVLQGGARCADLIDSPVVGGDRAMKATVKVAVQD